MENQYRLPRGAIAAIVIVALFLVLGSIFLLIKILRRFLCFRSRAEVDSYTLPVRAHGENASTCPSDGNQLLKPHSYVFSKLPIWGRKEQQHVTTSSSDRIIRLSLKDVQKATKNFKTIIGRGAFGPVYKAIMPDNSILAVKALAKNSKQGEQEFQREVMLLGRLHHRNLVNLVGYCADGGNRFLVYDYMSNGSLAERLHDERHEALTWGQRVTIAQDVARGIEYLHDGAVPPVIHRDIKSSNVLLDSFMVATVADFGLSKEVDPDMPASGIRGTYGYVDPEYISTNSLTYKSDVYSFGVLLFELIAGRSPEEGLMEYVEMILMAGNVRREGWLQLLDPRLKGNCDIKELGDIAFIASKCIEHEAKKRPSMREVVQAISRFGPRTDNSVLDILNLPSFKRFEKLERSEISFRTSSVVEVRG